MKEYILILLMKGYRTAIGAWAKTDKVNGKLSLDFRQLWIGPLMNNTEFSHTDKTKIAHRMQRCSDTKPGKAQLLL